MTDPVFGIGISRVDNEPRPAINSDLSIVGIVGSATGADATMYPLNTPVQIFSDDVAALTKLGAGSLSDAVNGINDQLGEFEVAARVVIVRVTAGASAAATMTNVIGSSLNATGIWALLNSGPLLGIIPRIILTPDVTSSYTAASGSAPAEANAVVAALTPVLDRLLGHAIVAGPTDTLAHWTEWRETIQSARIIPLSFSVKVGSPSVEKDASGRVAGIFVRRDHEKRGLPFWSSANQPIQGIVGPGRDVAFSLTDGSTEGQQILSQNGGILARGQMGVEQAIASGGFVYIGTDTCSVDDLWRFYNVSRGRDYIHLMFLRTLRVYLGRFNITSHTITAIQNTMDTALRDLKAQEAILGYKVGFTRDLNSPENIRLGKFTVSFAAEEAPVLRYLGIQSARYRPAIDALLDDLILSLSAVA